GTLPGPPSRWSMRYPTQGSWSWMAWTTSPHRCISASSTLRWAFSGQCRPETDGPIVWVNTGWLVRIMPVNPATRRLRWWKEVLAVVAFDAVYEWTSSKAAGAHAVAGDHAHQIVQAERSLGIFREHAIQQWFLPHRLLIEASDLFYSTVHFVLPVFTLIWLFRRFPERYVRWRNALAWMTGLGLVGFIAYPLLPPRFLPSSFGFVDTLNVVGGIGSWDSALMKDAGNLYAAMPSLHIAWALWCAFALV